jgi:pentapeptide MXKDX repeat protein
VLPSLVIPPIFRGLTMMWPFVHLRRKGGRSNHIELTFFKSKIFVLEKTFFGIKEEFVGQCEKMSTEKMSTEKMSTEKMSTEKMSTEKMSTEKMSTEKMSTEKMSTEKMSTFLLHTLTKTLLCGIASASGSEYHRFESQQGVRFLHST